jgi:hypothetical protein
MHSRCPQGTNNKLASDNLKIDNNNICMDLGSFLKKKFFQRENLKKKNKQNKITECCVME